MTAAVDTPSARCLKALLGAMLVVVVATVCSLGGSGTASPLAAGFAPTQGPAPTDGVAVDAPAATQMAFPVARSADRRSLTGPRWGPSWAFLSLVIAALVAMVSSGERLGFRKLSAVAQVRSPRGPPRS